MSTLDGFAGQEGPVGLLRRDLDGGRVAHSYLFSGAGGRMPVDIALAFAAALICEAGGCGACSVCRRVERRAHPDVDLIEPAGTQLLVDQVRDVVRSVWRMPTSGPRRVIVVEGADRMNPHAQNAFLKALEEPPTSATIVLVAADPEMLLPTVRSRCREVAFRVLADDEIARALEAHGADRADAHRWAKVGGGLERARALAFDPVERERRDGVAERVLRPVRDPGDAIEAAAWLAAETKTIRDRVADAHKEYEAEHGDWHRESKRVTDERLRREQRRAEQEALEAALDDVGSVLRDLAAAARSPDAALIDHGRRELIVRRAGSLGEDAVPRLLAALGDVERTRRRLRANANVLLALEHVFLCVARRLA